MPQNAKLDLLQGTLDLLVLQTLAAMGPLHGYGIARRIEQSSGDEVLLNQGTFYASLVRLQRRGWIAAGGGCSSVDGSPPSGASPIITAGRSFTPSRVRDEKGWSPKRPTGIA